MTNNGSLAKELFYDISLQSILFTGIGSIDAANCYNSITHTLGSMFFQVFGVPHDAIESMLMTIQDMKYFLRTAYDDPQIFVTSTIAVKLQGYCQGNVAVHAGWRYDQHK